MRKESTELALTHGMRGERLALRGKIRKCLGGSGPGHGEIAMPRTPLLRTLHRLARDHAAAERLGMPVDELREREEAARYSRRQLLARTGAVGAALAVPAVLTRPGRAAAPARVAIVGAGIAGLTAAL